MVGSTLLIPLVIGALLVIDFSGDVTRSNSVLSYVCGADNSDSGDMGRVLCIFMLFCEGLSFCVVLVLV